MYTFFKKIYYYIKNILFNKKTKDLKNWNYKNTYIINDFKMNQECFLYKYKNINMRNKLINIYSFNYNLNNLLIQKYKYIIINFHKKIIGDNIKIQIIFHLNLKVNNFDSIESYFNNESISKFNYIKTFNPLYISKNTKKNAFYNYLDTLLDSTFIVCNSGENLTINKIEIHYFYLLDDKGNWSKNIKKTINNI